MSRYIDADELKRNHMFYHEADNRSYAEERDIDETPTVDAVQVVRCKDCRWACLAPQRQTATCMKKRLPFTHGYDWFCADGERTDYAK